MKRSTVLFGLCLLVLAAFVLASPPSGYHLLKKIPFGAATGLVSGTPVPQVQTYGTSSGIQFVS